MKVVVKDPDEFESALREFRRKVQEQGLVREVRRRAHYVPPAEARKIKSIRARRRSLCHIILCCDRTLPRPSYIFPAYPNTARCTAS